MDTSMGVRHHTKIRKPEPGNPRLHGVRRPRDLESGDEHNGEEDPRTSPKGPGESDSEILWAPSSTILWKYGLHL